MVVLCDWGLGVEECVEFECFWVVFFGCLDFLEVDMWCVLVLGMVFLLYVLWWLFVYMGVMGGVVGIVVCVFSVRSLWYEVECDFDVNDLCELEWEVF